jgi:hypothetical protein
MPTPGGQYQVVRLLPAEGGEFLYRVKSKGETFERVVKESELAQRMPLGTSIGGSTICPAMPPERQQDRTEHPCNQEPEIFGHIEQDRCRAADSRPNDRNRDEPER